MLTDYPKISTDEAIKWIAENSGVYRTKKEHGVDTVELQWKINGDVYGAMKAFGDKGLTACLTDLVSYAKCFTEQEVYKEYPYGKLAPEYIFS